MVNWLVEEGRAPELSCWTLGAERVSTPLSLLAAATWFTGSRKADVHERHTTDSENQRLVISDAIRLTMAGRNTRTTARS